MRRRTKKTIHIIVIVFFILLCINVLYNNLGDWLQPNIPSTAETKGADVYIAYLLKNNEWTAFKIKGKPACLQITGNLEFLLSSDNKFTYGIEYMILDSKGEVLLQKIYYLKTVGKTLRKKHSKRVMSNPFLIQGNRYLTPSKDFIIPLTDLKDPVVIKLKPTEISYPATGLLVRVSQKLNVGSSKQKILWYRFNDARKKELASANFYPYYYLTQTEKKNIIKNLTSYTGPTKRSGKNCTPVRIGTLPRSEFHALNFNLTNQFSKANQETTEENKKDILELLLNSARGGVYKEPSNSNIDKAAELFEKLFNNQYNSSMKDEWNTIGMNIEKLKKDNHEYIVIYEPKGRRTGKGFYIFCTDKQAKNIVLEMPHRFFDIGTGLIGYNMMLTGEISAAAWNTVHRYQTPNNVNGSSDMAHTKDSIFCAFTRAFAKAAPEDSIMLQLHGYDKLGHGKKNKERPLAVISNSTETPGEHFMYYANLLKAILPQPAFIYPETQYKVLAALDNISAEIIRKYSNSKIFIHLEMSKQTRKAMNDKPELREQIIRALSSQQNIPKGIDILQNRVKDLN